VRLWKSEKKILRHGYSQTVFIDWRNSAHSSMLVQCIRIYTTYPYKMAMTTTTVDIMTPLRPRMYLWPVGSVPHGLCRLCVLPELACTTWFPAAECRTRYTLWRCRGPLVRRRHRSTISRWLTPELWTYTLVHSFTLLFSSEFLGLVWSHYFEELFCQCLPARQSNWILICF